MKDAAFSVITAEYKWNFTRILQIQYIYIHPSNSGSNNPDEDRVGAHERSQGVCVGGGLQVLKQSCTEAIELLLWNKSFSR